MGKSDKSVPGTQRRGVRDTERVGQVLLGEEARSGLWEEGAAARRPDRGKDGGRVRRGLGPHVSPGASSATSDSHGTWIQIRHCAPNSVRNGESQRHIRAQRCNKGLLRYRHAGRLRGRC